jgi:hypothetical protein
MDEPLSEENRRYLRQLGAHGMALEARLDEAYPPDAEDLAAFEKQERKAAADLNGQGLTLQDQADLATENARLKAELEAMRAKQDSQPPPDFSTMKKAELEAEIERVNGEDPDANLSKGTVAEMAAALTEYFAE